MTTRDHHGLSPLLPKHALSILGNAHPAILALACLFSLFHSVLSWQVFLIIHSITLSHKKC